MFRDQVKKKMFSRQNKKGNTLSILIPNYTQDTTGTVLYRFILIYSFDKTQDKEVVYIVKSAMNFKLPTATSSFYSTYRLERQF